MLHSKSVALLVAASVAAVSFAGAASAQEIPTISVPLTKVDFNNPAEVKSLYKRLSAAANQVCDTQVYVGPHTLSLKDRECAATSLERAINDARQPSLTAYHADKLDAQQVIMAKKAGAKDKQYAAQ